MRKHILSNDCWCNPKVVTFSEMILVVPSILYKKIKKHGNVKLVKNKKVPKDFERLPDASKTIDTQNDWAKRFDDEFPCLMHFRPNKKSYGYSEVGNDVKAFIAKLLADARKDERMKAEVEMGLKNFKVTMEEISKARKEVLEEIEKLLCTHNYSSMKSKETFNVKEEIRGVLATLKEERV